ncbi:hypothetical protein [Hoeflea sp.]|uniref:hypothetical protein n=1 Tax=Hoeflea sp. TaxID=1940281 RepID=UPI003B022AD1
MKLNFIELPVSKDKAFQYEYRPLPRNFLAGSPVSSSLSPAREPGYYFSDGKITGNPFLDAPLDQATGGTVYFESEREENLRSLVRMLMGYKSQRNDFTAFGISAINPVEERFLDQMKIVPHAAISHVSETDQNGLPGDQRVTMEEAIIGFVRAQSQKWNEPGRTFSSRLSGAAGGDGEYAKEALAFGLHMENTHWGVLRLWSRPWLVLK